MCFYNAISMCCTSTGNDTLEPKNAQPVDEWSLQGMRNRWKRSLTAHDKVGSKQAFSTGGKQ